MLQGVPVAFGSPTASAVHPADAMTSHRRRPARLPGSLRLGVASRCLVHRPVHGVDPPIFSAPLPPHRGR
jgi:hypothetical protein